LLVQPASARSRVPPEAAAAVQQAMQETAASGLAASRGVHITWLRTLSDRTRVAAAISTPATPRPTPRFRPATQSRKRCVLHGLRESCTPILHRWAKPEREPLMAKESETTRNQTLELRSHPFPCDGGGIEVIERVAAQGHQVLARNSSHDLSMEAGELQRPPPPLSSRSRRRAAYARTCTAVYKVNRQGPRQDRGQERERKKWSIWYTYT